MLLVIEARSPSQVCSDLQIFAEAVTEHVWCVYAFGWVQVVGASGCMDMMIARPPSRKRRVDPSFKVKSFGLGFSSDGYLVFLPQVFGTAGHLEIVFAGRKHEIFPVIAIHLGMEMKVRGKPLGL